MILGILGGGQLGRMLALAGHRLNVPSVYLDPSPDAAMRHVARGITAPYEDPAALAEFAEAADLVTWEFENIPIGTVRKLASWLPIYPPVSALDVKRDRCDEKTFFTELQIPVAPFAPANDLDHLEAALLTIGFPCVIKTRRHGYDGKGQVALDEPLPAAAVWRSLGEVPLIVEKKIAFERELAIIAVRGRSGEEAFYPLVETRQSEGILRKASAPADHSEEIRLEAEDYVARIVERLDYVGALALELFQVGDRLLANEMAPRVHNSGHWTIDAAATSQFENHIRAIIGWPLGRTTPLAHSVLVNLIGTIPPVERVLECPGAHLHLYDKEPRPGRKVGHVTFTSGEPEEARRNAARLETLIGKGG